MIEGMKWKGDSITLIYLSLIFVTVVLEDDRG